MLESWLFYSITNEGKIVFEKIMLYFEYSEITWISHLIAPVLNR